MAIPSDMIETNLVQAKELLDNGTISREKFTDFFCAWCVGKASYRYDNGHMQELNTQPDGTETWTDLALSTR